MAYILFCHETLYINLFFFATSLDISDFCFISLHNKIAKSERGGVFKLRSSCQGASIYVSLPHIGMLGCLLFCYLVFYFV